MRNSSAGKPLLMKKLYMPFFFFCCFVLATSLTSCDNSKQDYTFYPDYHVTFDLIDQKGSNLLQIGVNRYHKDTIQLYTENLEPLDFTLGKDGIVSFRLLAHTRELEEPLNAPIAHSYYLYLEEGD